MNHSDEIRSSARLGRVDAESFLSAILKISPTDSAEVREVADVKAKPDAAAERAATPKS